MPDDIKPLEFEPNFDPAIHIVLFQPEIPGNTGAVGRTCVGLNAKLWLVRPLGFRLDEKTVRRAGLDYWQHLELEVVNHWDHLLERLGERRLWLFSRFARDSYLETKFKHGDVLVFGSETAGLPKSISEKYADGLLRVPTSEKIRSLNLATTVGIAGFEMARQLGAL